MPRAPRVEAATSGPRAKHADDESILSWLRDSTRSFSPRSIAMKLMIATDMEGVGGVYTSIQTGKKIME